METVNAYPRQPATSAPPLPGEGSGAVPHARPHPWPEVAASWVATAVVFLSLWSMPAVLFGCVIVAIMGRGQ